MDLAASLYSSSRSVGASSLSLQRPHSHLQTVIGGISPEEERPDPDQDEDEDDGLPTIRESSRSSSNVNLLTPRVSLGGKALAGRGEDDTAGGEGDCSPKNGSLPSSGPSGLSLMLSRSVTSSPNKKREVAGTDKLASGASGALGVLDVPVDAEDEAEDGQRLSSKATGMSASCIPPRDLGVDSPFPAQDTGSSVTSSVTLRPGKKDSLHPSSQSTSSSPASSPAIHERNPTERTPLLPSVSENHHLQGTHTHGKPQIPDTGSATPSFPSKRHPAFQTARENVHSAYVSLRKATWRDVGQQVFVEPVKLLPATILGCLLNVLDGVSYGMIMYVPGPRHLVVFRLMFARFSRFPASPIFDNFGSLGVSMFFVS